MALINRSYSSTPSTLNAGTATFEKKNSDSLLSVLCLELSCKVPDLQLSHNIINGWALTEMLIPVISHESCCGPNVSRGR